MFNARQRLRRLSPTRHTVLEEDQKDYDAGGNEMQHTLSLRKSILLDLEIDGERVEPCFAVALKQPYQTCVDVQPALDVAEAVSLPLATECKPLTDNPLPYLESKRIMKKRAGFSSTVKVVLIPHVSEYHDGGLSPSIWWSQEELNTFLRDAFIESQASKMRSF